MIAVIERVRLTNIFFNSSFLINCLTILCDITKNVSLPKFDPHLSRNYFKILLQHREKDITIKFISLSVTKFIRLQKHLDVHLNNIWITLYTLRINNKATTYESYTSVIKLAALSAILQPEREMYYSFLYFFDPYKNHFQHFSILLSFQAKRLFRLWIETWKTDILTILVVYLCNIR